MTLLQGYVRVALVLSERFEHVQERIRQACARSRRDPASVRLVCVTKGVPIEVMRKAVALGITDVGENRVQEAQEKRRLVASPGVRWHLIGHLQRNKAPLAVELFDVIHSIDSLALIDALEKAPGRTQDAFVQVNVSGEASKSGVPQDGALALAEAVTRSSRLALAGLMTMAPLSDDPEMARPHFRRLRQLRDDTASALGVEPPTLKLSMGMSQDFEVAIEEGADFIRVGTAIFGPHA